MVTTTPETTPELPPLTLSSPPPPHSWSLSPEPRLVNAKWWVGLALGGAALLTLTLWGYSMILQQQLSKMSVPEVTQPPRVLRVTSQSQPIQPTAIQPSSSAKPAVSPPVAVTPVTKTPTLVKRKRPELTLNGIVEGRGEPVAIINGMILRIGDSVAGAILLEIRGEEARLRWRDEELLLSTTR